jgi:uncharacterized membrane protein YbhN (UPF0104 family)
VRRREPDLKAGPGRLALRLAAALLLTALAVRLVGWERLRGQLRAVDPAWLAAAVFAAGLSQWVSVHRWEMIARIFGLRVRTRALAIAYAQGMTLNVLLPGATLGGDTLRSVRLQALGNPLGESALTVLLDRLSGLWVLCLLSLFSAGGLAASMAWGAAAPAGPAGGAAGLAPGLAALAAWLDTDGGRLLYLGGLLLACVLPWLPLRMPRGAARDAEAPGPMSWARRIWRRLCGLHDLALAERGPLARSLWSSLLVQGLCALALWLCARAAGGDVAFWQVQAVAAPIFVAGSLPLSMAGFGARELAALVAFPLAGMGAGLGLAASALYGIVGVILGVLAAPAFAFGGGPAAGAAPPRPDTAA